MNTPKKTSKDSEFRSLESLDNDIFRNVPRVRELWQETEPQRRISLMLIRLRKKRGLSQKQIADHANWDKAFVSRLESGLNGMPDANTVARYAAACGLTAGVVIGERPDPEHMLVLDAITLHVGQGQEQVNSFERLKNKKLELNAENADALNVA